MILKGLSSVTVPGASITVTFNSGRGGTYQEVRGAERGGGKEADLQTEFEAHCGLELSSLNPTSLPKP